MNNSTDFDHNLFLKLANQWTEGARLDYKERVFKCDNKENEFKFVKILIALANVSRRIGKPCWILMGVKDKTRALMDVREQFVGTKKPEFWDNPDIDIPTKQTEGVYDRLVDIAKRWISPSIPYFSLEYGEIDNIFVSYIEIRPDDTSRPYSLKKRYKDFNIGTVFIRNGSSSLPVVPEEVNRIVCRSEFEYFEYSDWRNIINANLIKEFSEIENLSPYIDIKTTQPTNYSAINHIIDLINQGTNRILIRGGRGEGKTILLHKLASKLAYRHNQERLTSRMRFAEKNEDNNEDNNEDHKKPITNVYEELEVYPAEIIPIFFNLRTTFTEFTEIDIQLLEALKKITGNDKIRNIRNVFNIPNTQWVLLFDGLDEIRNIGKAGPVLRSWIETLPSNVKVVITSRPDYVERVDNFFPVELCKLSDDEIDLFIHQSILEKLRDEGEVLWKKVKEWLRNNQEIYAVIRNLRALQGFVDYILQPVGRALASIDQDQVNVTQPDFFVQMNINQTNELSEIPIIKNEDVIATNQVPKPDKPDYPQDQYEPAISWVPLSEAMTLRRIINYIIKEEMKRQVDFGATPTITSGKARRGLQKTAWMIDWDSDVFNIDICINKRWLTDNTRLWNQLAGFISQADPEENSKYKFSCVLLQHYFAAEYAIDNIVDDRLLMRGLRQRQMKQHLNKVIRLLNEFRQENGLVPI